MPKHKLYQMMLNCEDWRSSSSVGEMSAAARGVYIDLLTAAWLAEDCALPANLNTLRRLARPDSDAQWVEVWAELKGRFTEQDGRLYNVRQRSEFDKAQKLYSQRVKAGEASVASRAKKKKTVPENQAQSKNPPPKPRGEGEAEPERALEREGERALQQTYSLQPTVENLEPTTDKDRGKGPQEVQAVGSILTNFSPSSRGTVAELRGMVGESDWERSHGFWKWSFHHYPGISDTMDVIRNSASEEARASKGVGEIFNPGAFIRSEVKKWSGVNGIAIPADAKLNNPKG